MADTREEGSLQSMEDELTFGSGLPEPDKRVSIDPDILKDRETFLSVLGESFHTALRKATDSEQGSAAWNAIKDMDDLEYEQVLEFVAMCMEERD